MALPYLQIADPVRDAIPKVNLKVIAGLIINLKVPCWKKWSNAKKQNLMHDWSKEIDQMESQWEKRRNAQADKREIQAEEAKAQLGP